MALKERPSDAISSTRVCATGVLASQPVTRPVTIPTGISLRLIVTCSPSVRIWPSLVAAAPVSGLPALKVKAPAGTSGKKKKPSASVSASRRPTFSALRMPSVTGSWARGVAPSAASKRKGHIEGNRRAWRLAHSPTNSACRLLRRWHDRKLDRPIPSQTRDPP